MKLHHVAALASGVVLTGLLPSQSWESAFPTSDPLSLDRGDRPGSVPTRIETEPYGQSLVSSMLVIDVSPWGETSTTIRTAGGEPSAAAVLLVSNMYAQVPLSFGPLLVGPTIVPIPGAFDAAGEFHVPIDLGDTAFIGKNLFMQGAEVKATEINLSPGLRVSYHAGNAQRGVSWSGPPIEAIFVRNVGHMIPTLHGIVLRCHVPEGSLFNRLTVIDEVVVGPDTSYVYAHVFPDDTREVAAGPKTLRHYVDLGPLVSQKIEIWVSPTSEVSECICYEKVAVIETNLPEG